MSHGAASDDKTIRRLPTFFFWSSPLHRSHAARQDILFLHHLLLLLLLVLLLLLLLCLLLYAVVSCAEKLHSSVLIKHGPLLANSFFSQPAVISISCKAAPGHSAPQILAPPSRVFLVKLALAATACSIFFFFRLQLILVITSQTAFADVVLKSS